MHILLAAVNAKYIHSNPAIYSLKSACGHPEAVTLAEYTINHRPEKVLADIYEQKPDVVAFSCYIWNISFIEQLLADLTQVLPRLDIWLGGPEVSYDAKQVLKRFPNVKGVMVGEGECTFAALVSHYTEKQPELPRIRGIVFRQDDCIYDNGHRERMDMNSLPFYYRELPKDRFANRIIYYESSRGCPFSCSYCLSSIDRTVRFRDLELVKEELLYFLGQKVPQVKFIDRTFNCHKTRALDIWRFIKENGNGITNFHFEVGADLLDEEALELLTSMPPGMVQLEIGVQSTNPQTLKEIRRTTDWKRLSENVRRLTEKECVHCHLDLIAGLPYEDYESFQKSFNDVYALHPHQLQLGFLKVLKGSYMEEAADRYGLKYSKTPPYEVLSTKWLSYEQVVKLKEVEEMVELYANSSQFCFTLPVLIREFSSPFAFFDALADYYKKRNLLWMNHSRAGRYEILLDFCREQSFAGVTISRVTELLTLDLYAREPVKSRPDWASSLERFSGRIREFYEKEAKEAGCSPAQFKHEAHLEPCMDGGGVLFDYRRRSPITNNAQAVFMPGLFLS